MKNQKIIQKIFTLLLLLAPILSVMAQDDTFDDDIQDVPGAPIDNYLLLLLVVGIYLAFRVIKKYNLSINSN